MLVEALAEDWLAGSLIEPHRHELDQVVFAKRGVMRVTTARGAWVVPPERALWMPAGVEHAIRCGTAVAMRTVYLGNAGLDLGPGCVVLAVTPLLREVLIRLGEGAILAQVEPLAALVVSELHRIEAVPLHLPEPEDPRLRRLCRTLEADPGDRRPLPARAAEVNLSRRTLMRRFHSETGMTPGAWQRQLRLLLALERLAGNEPVTTVALDFGYESPSAFTAAFRKALGVPPSAYFRPPSRRP